MLQGRNFSLVFQDTTSYFAGDGTAGRICLGVEKGNKMRKRKSGKKRHVCFDGREKQSKNIGLSRCGMKVGAVQVLGDFVVGV